MTPQYPKWYEIALKENGVSETAGPASTARILQYHAATNHGAKDDETPWCSSFVNWCMKQAGITGTLSAGARSWHTWGVELKEPVIGCVVVFGYPNTWHGHVGFYAGMSGDFIRVYGGNQGNKVCTISMDKKLLLSYRWPSGIEVPKQEYATVALDSTETTTVKCPPDSVVVKRSALISVVGNLLQIVDTINAEIDYVRKMNNGN